MTDQHTDQIIHIRAEARTIEDFSFLPGKNNKERFALLVAAGLYVAQKTDTPSSVPPKPVQSNQDNRAIVDAAMARFNTPATPLTRSKLVDFDNSEIVAYVKTWGRKESLTMIKMLQQRVIEEEWHV